MIKRLTLPDHRSVSLAVRWFLSARRRTARSEISAGTAAFQPSNSLFSLKFLCSFAVRYFYRFRISLGGKPRSINHKVGPRGSPTANVWRLSSVSCRVLTELRPTSFSQPSSTLTPDIYINHHNWHHLVIGTTPLIKQRHTHHIVSKQAKVV